MVQLDRMGSLLVAERLLTAGLMRSAAGIPILMYHSVSDDSERGVAGYYRVATTPARFAEHMQWLAEVGYRTLGLDEALTHLHCDVNDSRFVVITFDDGFRDFYTHAWRSLAAFGFTATMFLPTAFIGSPRRTFKGRECLTWNEVRELRRAGMRFGSHTVSHPKLHGLDWSRIRAELLESRATLENELQETVRTFAYPYAFPQEDHAFSLRFAGELLELGYEQCVTTVVGRATAASNPLRMERLPANDADDHRLFLAKLAGAYDWVGGLQLISRRARQTFRKLRNR
jgi:peptidoglycan/xylan/chitin deacetylase (PgdA/CDA1 family)